MAKKPDHESEAVRLKALAEDKFKSSNLNSALKYSMKAESLYPNLDNISEMIMAFRIVQSAGEHSGEGDSASDWYKVLQVEPFAPINTIKKQYKKLALVLHPDKNTFPGSEEAFKLVTEAFRCLTDKIRRKEYDTKLRIAMLTVATSTSCGGGSKKFWTVCSVCRFVHQLERMYIGHNLMCPRCEKTFLAVEVEENEVESDEDEGDIRVVEGGSVIFKRKMCNVSEILGRTKVKKAKIKKEMTLAEMQRKLMQEKAKVKLVVEKEKMKDTKNLELRMCSAGRKKGDIDVGMNDACKKSGKLIVYTRRTCKKNGNSEIERSTLPSKNGNSENETNSSLKAGVGWEMKIQTLSEKCRKLDIETQNATKKNRNVEMKTSCISMKGCNNSEMHSQTNRGRNKILSDLKKITNPETDMCGASMDLAIRRHKPLKKGGEKHASKKQGDRRHLDAEIIRRNGDFEIMVVDDSEFYDFDKDRVQRSFRKGQVWAIYDDDDGMPRHYGLIDGIVSVNPFQLTMSWLNLQGNGDEALGCHLSCGRFKVGAMTSINSVNFFSHVVNCERSAREMYRIFPKKGSVWALHREGSADARERKSPRSYDIAVCLTSYSEVFGLSLGYLEKVDGFKTVFKRQEVGCHAIRWLEKGDVMLFSHQIPAKKLNEAEAPELLKDCWELDPASLPQNLLTIGWER